VCEAFAAEGADVLGVVRSEVARPLPVPLARLDVCAEPPGRLAELLRERRADVVVNAAGAVWRVTAEETRRGNVELPERLLAALSALDHRPRLVHLGSVHEYGPGAPGEALREDTAPEPVNAYGRSKLLATRAVLRAAGEGRVDGVVLRVSNVCGPWAPAGSLLGLIARHLALVLGRSPGEPPVPPLRLSPLRDRRDFVDVRDVADAVVAAARTGFASPDAPERLLNIGRGEVVGVRTLVDRLIALSGLDAASVVEEHPAEEAPAQSPPGTARPDGGWQQIDVGRARRLLHWRPRRPLEQSLRDQLATVPHTPASDAPHLSSTAAEKRGS